jgi:hypothetical protein
MPIDPTRSADGVILKKNMKVCEVVTFDAGHHWFVRPDQVTVVGHDAFGTVSLAGRKLVKYATKLGRNPPFVDANQAMEAARRLTAAGLVDTMKQKPKPGRRRARV